MVFFFGGGWSFNNMSDLEETSSLMPGLAFFLCCWLFDSLFALDVGFNVGEVSLQYVED